MLSSEGKVQIDGQLLYSDAGEQPGYGGFVDMSIQRRRGINHSFEFEAQEQGKIGYDYLTYLTQEDLVVFEMDLFWIVNAGHDPVRYFGQWPNRFPMLHVKDRIFSHVDTAGFKHYFIEHDYPTDGINSIAFSYNTLNDIRF